MILKGDAFCETPDTFDVCFMFPTACQCGEKLSCGFFKTEYSDDTICTVIADSPVLAVLSKPGQCSLCAVQMQNGEYTLFFITSWHMRE